ncbi:hypothetical protein [Psychromonas algicola]|nr:hypothetical protein [Psychromonas sp. RZ5]
MTRNESETRAELISPKLTLDGWGVIEHSIIRRENKQERTCFTLKIK